MTTNAIVDIQKPLMAQIAVVVNGALKVNVLMVAKENPLVKVNTKCHFHFLVAITIIVISFYIFIN